MRRKVGCRAIVLWPSRSSERARRAHPSLLLTNTKACDSPRARTIWWTIVAAFALLNLFALILRDSADNERLQALVDAQRPAVSVAQKMTTRMRTVGSVAQRVAARRAQREPLGALAATTIALPDGAWVQRYAWDGATVRLTGYRARDADVAAALRRSSWLANVKSAQTDAMGETATGQPFDLTAQIRGR